MEAPPPIHEKILQCLALDWLHHLKICPKHVNKYGISSINCSNVIPANVLIHIEDDHFYHGHDDQLQWRRDPKNHTKCDQDRGYTKISSNQCLNVDVDKWTIWVTQLVEDKLKQKRF